MKSSIHPQYFESLQIVCSCGNIIIAGSTKKTIKTEICSACHPFFTGQQKLVDTAGRVDKFMASMKKAAAIKAKKVKKVDEEVGEIMHHQEEEEALQESAAPVQPKMLLELDEGKAEVAEKPAKKATTKKAATKKAASKK